MPTTLDAFNAAVGAPAGNAAGGATLAAFQNALAAATAPDANPATGSSNLQVWNPFGQNFDTGIGLGNTGSRIMEGVGGAFSDAALGARQLAARVAGGNVSGLQQEVHDKRALDAPLMATGGGRGGNVLGNLAIAAPTAFIPGVNTYTGAALVGAGLGAMQPTESGTETLTNAAIGGVAGAGGKFIGDQAAKLAGALRSGGGANLTPGQQDALKIADDLGFKTTPANRTGSKVLAQIESKLESQPESSGPFNAIRAANDRVMGKAAANSIGETADNVSSQVLARAESRLGNVFDSVADSTPVPLDPQVIGPKLQQVLKDSEGMIGQNGSLADNGLFKRLDSFVNDNGGATREQLRDLSSKLGRAAKNNLTTQSGDRELGMSLMKLQGHVEDAIQGTLSKAQAEEYAAARQQYGNLMSLTARNTVLNPSTGNVNGRALANVLMSKDRGGFTFGKNDSDLYNAARFAQAFPSMVGDSGTATRMPFSISQLPQKLAGALGSRWYMNAADMASGGLPSSVPGSVASLGLNSDPLAKELAKLLMLPGVQQALPTLSAEGALQGTKLIGAPQQ